MASIAAKSPVSPSSSPRLPSPPPFPEVQIGPKSNTPGEPVPSTIQDGDRVLLDNGAMRRIRPGTKASEMSSGPPLIPLAELDSPFQLQEHLKALYLDATKSENNNALTPITREAATILATPPENVDRSLWLYELCRFLVQKANSLIVGFFSDTPPCSAKNCPEMRASEWQYLCAVHDPPRSCCAIDYCCHTLDWAANVLTSQKHYPSRLTLGSEASGGGPASVRQLTNIFRRVYRMFAHAWFSHRDVFWALENQEGMYIFYKTVCDMYQLIPEENYTVPPEAEGVVIMQEQGSRQHHDPAQDAFAPSNKEVSLEPRAGSAATAEAPAQTILSTGATTRRHKNTPSTGSFVSSIAEGDEDREGKSDFDRNSERSSTVKEDGQHFPVKKLEPIPQEKGVEKGPEKAENLEVHPEDDATIALTEKTGSMKLEDLKTPPEELTQEANEKGKGEGDELEEREDENENEKQKEDDRLDSSQGMKSTTEGEGDKPVVA